MLTRKQKELLFLIRDHIAKDGIPPSFDEMKTALGLRSKSGIHRLITGLEERGFIRRLPHRARALEIIRFPEGSETQKPTMGQQVKALKEAIEETLQLPMYGRIAAGTPIEAITDVQSHIDIPPSMITNMKGGQSGEHYALEIAGDSMIEAGIMDGDQVIIRKSDTAENGAIVVALVDDHEATLKYLQRRKGDIILVPANEAYEERILESHRVKVQGKLVGLVRKY